MKKIGAINKKIDEIVWDIEFVEVEGHQGDDLDVFILYLKFASSEGQFFTYKFRFPKTLLTTDAYGLDTIEKRFNVGMDKATSLIMMGFLTDFISTRHMGHWKDEDYKGSLIKHSSYKVKP